jgi:hypothetical protein
MTCTLIHPDARALLRHFGRPAGMRFPVSILFTLPVVKEEVTAALIRLSSLGHAARYHGARVLRQVRRIPN